MMPRSTGRCCPRRGQHLPVDRPTVAACPVCDNRDAACRYSVKWMMTALGDPEVRRADADGLCVPHLLAALPADAERGRLLVETALARLANPLDLAPVAGWDRDANTRTRLRASLPAEDAPQRAHGDHHPGTVDRLSARLALGACPSCLAAGQAERRYLYWMRAAYAAEGAELVGNQPGAVCGRHLYDLADLDTRVAGWALVHTAKRWAAQLARVRDRLGAVHGV